MMPAKVIDARHFFEAKRYLQGAFPDRSYLELKERIMALAAQIKEREDANGVGFTSYMDFKDACDLSYLSPGPDPKP